VRNDLIRGNSYWQGYEAIRWALTTAHRRNHGQVLVADASSRRQSRRLTL
jgi:hypothetical protein